MVKRAADGHTGGQTRRHQSLGGPARGAPRARCRGAVGADRGELVQGGGIVAGQFCLDDARCRAVLNLDGDPQYGDMIDRPLARPLASPVKR